VSASKGLTYILPLRWTSADESRATLTEYLAELARWCDDVIVVDGSPPAVFTENGRSWRAHARHVAPDRERLYLNGKVAGVLTGVELARHERIVIADDDVRYDGANLLQVARLLDGCDLVAPQNFFSPHPWHALWDTARILLNRSVGADFPGTLGVRRTVLQATGGYDGDVLFENLELIRTVEAHGGRIVAPDLFVRRLPPDARQFWGQRTRQAYDDFAIPSRMTIWLSIVPASAFLVLRRRMGPLMAGAVASIALAERGRRRGGGQRVFPWISSVLAPVWIAERAVCSWLAVLQRVRFGGVRYREHVIRVAAHSPRELRERARSRPRSVPR
jgi:hypothetical protein